MIKVDYTGRKKLTFHVQVWGTNLTALRGVFVIVDGGAGDDGVEYRFEGKLENGKIQILLPPLSHVIARPVANDTVFRTYLEVMGEGLYNIPWKDEVLIKVREAHIESVEQGEPKLETKENKSTKQSILEIETEEKSEVDGKDKSKEKVDKHNATEKKIHGIIREMQKFNVVKEIKEKTTPEPDQEVIEEIAPEVKEEKQEVFKEDKIPEIETHEKDIKRHEKKVMASLLSVANQ